MDFLVGLKYMKLCNGFLLWRILVNDNNPIKKVKYEKSDRNTAQ